MGLGSKIRNLARNISGRRTRIRSTNSRRARSMNSLASSNSPSIADSIASSVSTPGCTVSPKASSFRHSSMQSRTGVAPSRIARARTQRAASYSRV